jgi:hypothetical protein
VFVVSDTWLAVGRGLPVRPTSGRVPETALSVDFDEMMNEIHRYLSKERPFR